MASNNTSATLRAATVSRALAKAGVARARLDKAGLPQCSGFVARDSGLVGQVTVRWATLSFGAVRERQQGLGECETALKAVGYKVQRDGDRLAVSRPKARYVLMDAVSAEEFGDFESLDEADRFLVRGGVSGVEWAESDDGESWRGWHKGEKAYIVRRKTAEGRTMARTAAQRRRDAEKHPELAVTRVNIDGATVDLDSTRDCPTGERCAACGVTGGGLTAVTYETVLGVLCATICARCVDERRPPKLAGWTDGAEAVAAHCGHLGIDLDQMGALLDGER